MKRISRNKRLIIGILAFVLSAILSYFLSDLLGNLSMLLTMIGSAIFVYLNPELMRGE